MMWIYPTAWLISGMYLLSISERPDAMFQAGAASRDAEIEELKTVPMKYRRMAFNAQLQDENAKLNQQLAAEQAKNVELRELVEHFALIDLSRSLLPGDFGLWVLRARKTISTPSDTSALEAVVKKAGEVMRERFRIAEAQGWLNKEFIHALLTVTLEDLK